MELVIYTLYTKTIDAIKVTEKITNLSPKILKMEFTIVKGSDTPVFISYLDGICLEPVFK